MAGHDLDFTHLDDLAQALRAAGVRNVALDPADLNLPGVLIQTRGISLDLLDGLTIRTRLLCISGDRDWRRAMDTLAGLFNTVTAVVDPTEDTTAETAQLPEDPTPYPALAVPFDLPTT